MSDTCPLNRCGRPLGIGTHMSLASGRDGKSQQTIAICEEHWQALREIFPAEQAQDRRPHSRACGIRAHEHGPACANDCPTCAAPKAAPRSRTRTGTSTQAGQRGSEAGCYG